MLTRLRQYSDDQRELEFLDRAQTVWDYFSKGSHPTDVGIIQTHGRSAGKGVLGAAFHQSLWDDGIRNGLISAFLLVHETGRLQKQSQQWEDEVKELAVFIPLLTSPDTYQSLIDTTKDSGS